jgi:hypothetical protein
MARHIKRGFGRIAAGLMMPFLAGVGAAAFTTAFVKTPPGMDGYWPLLVGAAGVRWSARCVWGAEQGGVDGRTSRCDLTATDRAIELGDALVECLEQRDWPERDCQPHSSSCYEFQDYSAIANQCGSEITTCVADTVNGNDACDSSLGGWLGDHCSAESGTLSCQAFWGCTQNCSASSLTMCKYACWDKASGEARQLGSALAQCIAKNNCEEYNKAYYGCVEEHCEPEFSACMPESGAN